MQPPWSINSVVQSWAKRFLVKEHHAELLNSLHELRELKQQFREPIERNSGNLFARRSGQLSPGGAN